MLYAFLIVTVLVVAVLMLRLRLRFEFSSDKRLLFVGVGRSGPEMDYAAGVGRLKLFGRQIHSWPISREKPLDVVKDRVSAAKSKVIGKGPMKEKPKRAFDIRGILRMIPGIGKALWRYFLDLLKSTIVEQAEGEIEAGFEEPDLTGQAFGFYQAALAVAPSVVGRVNYIPDWTGASFSGTVRASVALPLYRLVWLTLVLLWRLPIVRIIRLARGDRKGVQDG